MKNAILTLLIVVSQSIFYACGQTPAQTANDYIRPYTEPFQYGSNLGFYNNSWTDDNLATIAQAVGAHSLRPTLPESFLEQYGYSVRTSTFNNYVNNLGMRELTCFVEGPSPAHRDMTVYPTATGPSKLFAHLYEPIWNYNGTVNQNNYYAYYLYQLLQVYGDKVRYWEVVNEPDFTYGNSMNDWLTRAPQPGELFNLEAPIYHYVRMLRISYEVIKKYHPEAYVTVGGVGYPQFVDALLRYTDNPVDGSVTWQYPNKAGAYLDALSFHSYPTYSLHYWDNALNAFRYTRTSDYAANKVMDDKQAMVDVMSRYGYGTTYPAKQLLISETNISRRTSGDRTGSDESQRNFGIKTLVLAQKNGITQLYFYALGEAADAPADGVSVSGNDEFGLMGLYQNLTRIAPNAERPTNLGQAFHTTSSLLYGAYYDAARTAALALPSNIDGAAFNKNGTYYYVLWAKALVDNSENASATYSFPLAWNMGTVNRYEWDYSVTSTKTTQSARNIYLTSSPSFFTAASAGTVTPPPSQGSNSGCAGTGSLLREQWNNVWGTQLGSIPLTSTPASTAPLTQFEATSLVDYNYGARLRGYLCPPQSGAYSFFVAGDDQAELWLSTDDDPGHAVRIASCTNWIASVHDFYRYPSQQSAAINLQAGQRYYVEARHKQGWGPGFVAVAWRLPNGTTEEPIPGSALIPFAVNAGRGGTAGKSTTATSSPSNSTGEAAAQAAFSVFPNPFNRQATVQFSTPQDGKAELALYDLQGRLVRRVFGGPVAGGVVQNVLLDVPGLSNGMYLLRLTTSTQVLTQRVVYSDK